MTKGGTDVSAAAERRDDVAGETFRLPLERLDTILFDVDGLVASSGASPPSRGSSPNEARAFADTIGLLSMLHELGVPQAVVTSRGDGARLLSAAGLDGLFTIVVDGRVAEQ